MNIDGKGAPTKSTFGTIGDYYIDTTTDTMYKLVDINNIDLNYQFIEVDSVDPEKIEYIWEVCGSEQGGIELIRLYKAGLAQKACYWDNGSAGGESVTGSEAYEIYTKWISGRARVIILHDRTLDQGGCESYAEVISISLIAANSSGTSVEICAYAVDGTSIERCTLSHETVTV